ncbi:hypothetical protein ACQZ4Y_24465 [Rhizobium sp. L80/93]|uniref:hypothetical protein n=1 Tax=Rhizobium sp. E27B/91 TaxID=2819995 RepID=UPI001ADD611C|nr:hypothetical protein [Rhizobium sp. E27B/91]MBO9188156.1 hypothetical protein [Rhizobium sp. E27B/91]
MLDLLNKIYEKNEECGFSQTVSQGQPPETILMIDRVTRKPLSPQMRDFYSFALTWTEGLTGLDVADPNTLEELYANSDVKESIDLKAEDYKPLPPSDPSDWRRTALLALEDGGQGLGLCFYWWKSDAYTEPCIVFISGGTINVFVDLEEYAEHLANGTFPEQGDAIYQQLEQDRGTLSD